MKPGLDIDYEWLLIAIGMLVFISLFVRESVLKFIEKRIGRLGVVIVLNALMIVIILLGFYRIVSKWF